MREVSSYTIEYTGLIVAGIALIISFCALIISYLDHKENKKMIEESLRPYIVIYLITTKTSSSEVCKVVVKNIGKTAAYIEALKHSNIQDLIYDSDTRKPFDKLNDSILAPNQKVIVSIDPNKIKGVDLTEEKYKFKFEVKYKISKENKKEYEDEFNIGLEDIVDLIKPRRNIETDRDFQEILTHSIQNIHDEML